MKGLTMKNLKLTLLLSAFAAGVVLPQTAGAIEQNSRIVVAQQDTTKSSADERKQRREQVQQKREQNQQRREQRQNAQQNQQQQNNRPANAGQTKPQNQTEKATETRPQNPNVRPQTPANRAGGTNNAPANRASDTKTSPSNANPTAEKATDTKKPAANERNQNNNQRQVNEPKRDNKPDNKPAAAQKDNNTPAAQKNDANDANKDANKEAFKRDAGPKRLDEVKRDRKEVKEGNRTVIKEDNRTIVKVDNRTIIRHDDTDRFRRAGGNVQVQRRGDTTQTVIVRPGGVRIVNVVDTQGRLIRRSRWVNGREIVLINNRYTRPGFVIINLPPPIIRIPRERYIVEYRAAQPAWLYETLVAPPVMNLDRHFSLEEIRYNETVRARMPRIDIDSINFETGSWEVTPDQARLLQPIAEAMARAIEKNPAEVYLIEGHTDAVGTPEDNLSLSDRRAEAVAEVLTSQFNIPPENLVTQGYGEQDLKVQTEGAEPRNRYVTVRRVTPLLAQNESAAQ
jgi:outer membrane protein OmpA-like peptidoglycan-associated protein